jgi:hypothetical protein
MFASSDRNFGTPQAKAPEVHVTVEQRPSAVRLEIDEHGTKRLVVEDEE